MIMHACTLIIRVAYKRMRIILSVGIKRFIDNFYSIPTECGSFKQD